jgi:aspartyl-tRNA synthetase
VKCFRDEDLRADRQPNLHKLMKWLFGARRYLNVFEGLTRHLLKEIKGIEVEKFPRITYEHAMKTYGNDKPDIRFGMEFELNGGCNKRISCI